jgi:hypothetical protein
MPPSCHETRYPLSRVHHRVSPLATHNLEETARMVGMHPELLRYYCRQGMLGESMVAAQPETRFDDNAIYELARFEHFRTCHGMRRRTALLVCSLLREVDRLREELQFRRGP